MYEYKNILIIRYGEISLKGQNKPWFERRLDGRIRSALAKTPGAEKLKLKRSDGLMVLSGPDRDLQPDADTLIKSISKVFGVASVSPAIRLEDKHFETISEAAVDFMRARLDKATKKWAGCEATGSSDEDSKSGKYTDEVPTTFKVFGKRSDKSYPITSPDLAARIGEVLLNEFKGRLKVDVNDPDIALNVHLRKDEVFIFDEKFGTYGGLPLGTNGKALVLLSGGIDSPVAAWLMAKRGMQIEAVHFHSYPYTSERAQEKTEELAEILAAYCGRIKIHMVNLLPVQEEIAKNCPEEFMTLLVRRFMMRIAETIAKKTGCKFLITGECLGQVASQTTEALCVTDSVCTMPVMRPLIAFEKTEIMDIARDIGTYEKSIEPYDDCCTVFLPKHPATRPKLSDIETSEKALGHIDTFVENCISSAELKIINDTNSRP